MTDTLNFQDFPVYDFLPIEPRLKRQQKELDKYRNSLGIKNKEEDFVLKCILSFDWNKQLYLGSIEKIIFEDRSIKFRVYVRVPRKTIDYSCGNPFADGWILNSFKEKAKYVYFQLQKYIV